MLESALGSFQSLQNEPTVVVWLILMVFLAAHTDLKTLKIPNALNATLAVGNLFLFVVFPLLQGERGVALSHALSGLTGFLALLVPAVIVGFQMAGDIKLVGAFALALNPLGTVLFLGVSVLLNGLVNGTLIALKRKTAKQVVPFAPFFALSFAILLLITKH